LHEGCIDKLLFLCIGQFSRVKDKENFLSEGTGAVALNRSLDQVP
jgi:hypothetical protein